MGFWFINYYNGKVGGGKYCVVNGGDYPKLKLWNGGGAIVKFG